MRKIIIVLIVSVSVLASCAANDKKETTLSQKAVQESSISTPLTSKQTAEEQVPAKKEDEQQEERIVPGKAENITEQKTDKPDTVNKNSENNPPKTPQSTLSSRSARTPQISGSQEFKSTIMSALELLNNNAPDYSPLVIDYLVEIREGDHSGVQVETGVFTVGRNTYRTQNAVWLASIIVHDAVHVKLFKEGKTYHGKEGESAAIKVQREVLIELDAPQSYLEHLDGSLESSYWEVPFIERDW